MAIKAFLFTQTECRPCADARKALDKYLKNGEVKEMDVQEGLKNFNLGDPDGVPFLGFISEETSECIAKVFIGSNDESEDAEDTSNKQE